MLNESNESALGKNEGLIAESPSLTDHPRRVSRRLVLASLSTLGVGTLAFQRALAAQVEAAGKVTPEMIKQAEWIAGLELTDEERKRTADDLQRSLKSFEKLRKVDVGYDIAPAISFVPDPTVQPVAGVKRNQASPIESRPPKKPDSSEALAFLPVSELSALIRERIVSSTELTKLYLDRLKRFDPILKCVVNLTEELALKQSAKADAEIAAGLYRGPLHGIPWGAKDLIAYPGYLTTWGVPQFKDRIIDEKATVAARLEEAGAVLVAKLSLGALAQGDKWFGGVTKSPWDPRRGSSGSSAGSASAVAAGLVGFAIGSETLGSIVSPCRACGATGLRPTFGRVSRYGCMTLAWSMDKLGPITRSIEDCALVFDAIHGADGLDAAAIDLPFSWPAPQSIKGLRLGYVENKDKPADQRDELKLLKSLGLELVPIELPKDLPAQDIVIMLGVESATVFDDFTRKHVTEGLNTWPDSFREGQFVPAVEYLRCAGSHAFVQGDGQADEDSRRLLVRGRPDNHKPDWSSDGDHARQFPRHQWERRARVDRIHRSIVWRVDAFGGGACVSAGEGGLSQASAAGEVLGGGGS